MGPLSCLTGDRRKPSPSLEEQPSPKITATSAIKVVDSVVYTKTINGHYIAFTDFGFANDGPAIVTFSGWNQDHRGWANVTPYLMDTNRVISVCFRGYGPNRDPVEDFGFEDHARDVLGILDSLGVDQFVCMSTSRHLASPRAQPDGWPAALPGRPDPGPDHVRGVAAISGRAKSAVGQRHVAPRCHGLLQGLEQRHVERQHA